MEKRWCAVCGKSNMTVKWYSVDDNMEESFCRPCAKEMRESGEFILDLLDV